MPLPEARGRHSARLLKVDLDGVQVHSGEPAASALGPAGVVAATDPGVGGIAADVDLAGEVVGSGHLGNPSVRLGPIPSPVRVMPQYADRCKGFFRPGTGFFRVVA